MPKKLLVLGATGGTGRHVVSQALELGHEVTVLVRDPSRLTTASPRLRVVTGSVTDSPEPLTEAIRGQDAVISALGVGNSLKSGGLIARSVPVLVQAMRSSGVRRVVFTSAYGVGPTFGEAPFIPRLFMRTLLRDLYQDKAAGEEVMQRSGLDWTLVYPVTLTDGARTSRYRAGEHLGLRGFPTVSRADVAEFLLKQVEDATYLRRRVLIGP